MNPIDYTNHSGGAEGADLEWEAIGRKHGFETHIHWRPEHLNNLTPEGRKDMLRAYMNAAKVLARPEIFRGMELCQRNWIPTYHAEAIYAISYIVQPGQIDTRGRENKSGKEVVAGGTGWTVEMAIQMGKPVWIFDMQDNQFYQWVSDKFVLFTGTPILTETYSGIGARSITNIGKLAIEAVYKKTKEQCLILPIEKPAKT